MNEYIGVKDGFEPSMQEVAEPAIDTVGGSPAPQNQAKGEKLAPVAVEHKGAENEEAKGHNSECAEARRQGEEKARRDFDSIFCDNDDDNDTSHDKSQGDFDSTVEVNEDSYPDEENGGNEKRQIYKKMVIEQRMKEDLAEIRAIDSNISELSQLGDNFTMLIASGVPALAAYHATKAMLENEVFSPSMGSVSTGKRDNGDFFTREEVALMSPAQVKRYYNKVRKSMGRWK